MSGGDYIVVNNVFLDSAQSIRFGGNAAVPGTIFINSSINLTKNLSLDRINADGSIGLTNVNAINVIVASSFLNQLNTIFDGANSSFNQTNTEFGIINLHYTKSNSAFAQANLVYGVINVAYTRANANLSNIYNTYNKAVAAYNQANITIPLFIATNAAFLQVNSLYDSTNSVYNSANNENLAQVVFSIQNTYSDLSNTVIHLLANNAYNSANNENIAQSAFASINVTNTVTSNAYRTSNIAVANTNFVNTAITASFNSTNTANSVIRTGVFPTANLRAKIETLCSNVALSGLNTFELTNTTITKPYRKISFYFRNLKHGSNNEINWRIRISTNNGADVLSLSTDPAETYVFFYRLANGEILQSIIELENADSTIANDPRTHVGWSYSNIPGNFDNDFVQFNQHSIFTTGHINWVQFAWGTGGANFDGTTLTAFGWDY